MTIEGLVRDWNKNIPNMAQAVKQSNQVLLDEMESGQLEAEAVIKAWMPTPSELPLPGSRWARWFLKEWGWSWLSRASDTQSWLPYSHPDMKAQRERLKTLLVSGRVHPALVLNFDQLWRSCYQFGGTLLYKERKRVGSKSKRCKAPKKSDKKLHMVKGARKGITEPQM